MELYNLPFIKRSLGDEKDRQRMAERYAKVHQRYGYLKAGAIMQSISTAINSLTAKLGLSAEGSTEHQMLRTQRDRLMDLATRCNTQLLRTIRYRGYAHMIYRVKVERALGVSRRLSNLRNVIYEIAGIDAIEHIKTIAWLGDQTGGIGKCGHCGDWEYSVKLLPGYDDDMDEIEICRSCAEDTFTHASRYSRYVHSDNVRYARMPGGGDTVCHENDEDFRYSEDLDYWHHVDYEPPPPPIIGRYHNSKPLQRVIVDEWSRLKHRWFGVELEVELKDRSMMLEDKARQLHDLINGGEHGKKVFFESDGSLTHGFEIITQPMSLPAHHELWQFLRDREAVRNLLSHNTRTCGLHVHVNKDSLSQIQIAKIVTFINDPRNESMIRAIARRYAEGYCKIKEKKLESAHQSTDRYEAVNLTGRNTIEFRIFKGSLKYESVVAAVEFCHALCDFAALPSTNDVASLTGDNFIDYINNAGAAESNILRPYMNAVLQTA